jgi:hypothetical protein
MSATTTDCKELAGRMDSSCGLPVVGHGHTSLLGIGILPR